MFCLIKNRPLAPPGSSPVHGNHSEDARLAGGLCSQVGVRPNTHDDKSPLAPPVTGPLASRSKTAAKITVVVSHALYGLIVARACLASRPNTGETQ